MSAWRRTSWTTRARACATTSPCRRRRTPSSSPGPAPRRRHPTPRSAPTCWSRPMARRRSSSTWEARLISIGRASDNDVIVDDALVSRHHCQLKLQHGAYGFADLGSRNGSFVNGQPVNEIALGPGDMIRIGVDGDRVPGARMTGEVLRILLLVLQLGFLGLLYLILLALRALPAARPAQRRAGAAGQPGRHRTAGRPRVAGRRAARRAAPSRWGRSTPSAAT